MECTDYELIERCLSGDRDSFAEIVGRYNKLVYSVVYNMMPDKQDVYDISQEVFMRIYKSLHRYNPEFKFSTWSVKITTNLCLDILRKKKPDLLPIDDIKEVAGKSLTPEEIYINKERAERVREAIRELPEKYRLPIVLFHQQGLSYEEITQALNEPMTIVKNRLYRARVMLRQKLSRSIKEEMG